MKMPSCWLPEMWLPDTVSLVAPSVRRTPLNRLFTWLFAARVFVEGVPLSARMLIPDVPAAEPPLIWLSVIDRLTLLPKSKMPVPWFAKGVFTVTLLWAITAPLLLVATTKVESSTLLFFVTDSLTDGLADDPAKLIAVCPELCPVKLFSVMAVLLAGPLLMNTPVPHCGPRVPAP